MPILNEEIMMDIITEILKDRKSYKYRARPWYYHLPKFALCGREPFEVTSKYFVAPSTRVNKEGCLIDLRRVSVAFKFLFENSETYREQPRIDTLLKKTFMSSSTVLL